MLVQERMRQRHSGGGVELAYLLLRRNGSHEHLHQCIVLLLLEIKLALLQGLAISFELQPLLRVDLARLHQVAQLLPEASCSRGRTCVRLLFEIWLYTAQGRPITWCGAEG